MRILYYTPYSNNNNHKGVYLRKDTIIIQAIIIGAVHQYLILLSA